MLVPMNWKSAAGLVSGLFLLTGAAWLVPSPRLVPRPELPEIAPFSTGERIALILPGPENLPSPDAFGLVQRARAAGAEVRIFTPGDPIEAFAPDHLFRPFPGPNVPAGFHPDQWPARPSGEGWQMVILTPAEQAALNAAVLAAARVFREAGDAAREIDLLSHARRAEIYLPLGK